MKITAISAPSRRVDRRRARTRAALLEAGRSLLAHREVEGVSIDEIVAAADVAKGSFYNHFADKDVFAREIGAAVRRQAEAAIARENAGIEDPALRLAQALCVFVRFAIEHRESAQVLWRLNSGATMADAPINRGLRDEVILAAKSAALADFDVETGVLLVMGTIIIALRHVLEQRVVTPPPVIAARMSAGMLRALGFTARRAQKLAAKACKTIFGQPTKSGGAGGSDQSVG
jgi:AcrR family transcriptional regulator